MNCESCSAEMIYQYDVVERETMFVLWDCECGHKLLERRPLKEKALVGAYVAPIASADDDDDL
ncbi:MAG: hypothetical protein AB7N76_30230 [Planctomycetota bacterium]